MKSNSHIRKVIAGTILAATMTFTVPPILAQASEDTSAEQEAAFQEWYNASQENRDYYHWYEWVHASPENEAYWRWKTEQDRQARAYGTGGVDGAITHYFGSANTALGAQARRVAQCESGMNPSAKSPTNDHGLFQLNAPSHSSNFPRVTGSPFYNGVYNPYENAEYARNLYNQQGWSPWTCKP